MAWRGSHLPTAVAAVVVGVVRWWTSHRRAVVHMLPDEPGQLAIARFVGRGARWNMFDHSTWRPAFGTLVAPVTWFTDDPVAVYKAALAVNAVLGAVSCVLLALLAARLTGRSRLVAAGMAALVSLSPALLFTTNWVWSEALVQVTFLLFVLAALRFFDAARLAWGLTMVAAAALGFATHSRLLPLAASAVVLIAVLAARRRLRWPTAAALVALLGVLLLAVSRYSRWLVDRIWEAPAPTNTAGGVLERVGDPGALAVSATGQIWYQLVACVGLAGLGTLAVLRVAAGGRRRQRGGEPTVTDARILLLTIAPLVGLSIVFMTDRWRPDQIVYGRYNDAVMAPLVIVGLGVLLVAGVRRLLLDGAIVVGAIVVGGVVLRMTSDERLQERGLLRSMVLGLLGYLGHGRLQVLGVTVAAASLTVVLLVTALAVPRGARTALVGAGAAVLVLAGFVRTRPIVDSALNTWASASSLADVRGTVLPPGAMVRDRIESSGVASKAQQRQRLMLYEFYLPDNTLYRDRETPGGTWTPYVFAPLDDVDLRAARARVVWRDPAAGIALWVERKP
jgi:hypothetical protein